MEEIKTKVCTKCGKELPLSEFSSTKGTPDGLSYQCKECSREYHREYNKRRKEQRLAAKEKGRMLEIIPESTASEEVLMNFLLKVQPRLLIKALIREGTTETSLTPRSILSISVRWGGISRGNHSLAIHRDVVFHGYEYYERKHNI